MSKFTAPSQGAADVTISLNGMSIASQPTRTSRPWRPALKLSRSIQMSFQESLSLLDHNVPQNEHSLLLDTGTPQD